LGGEHTAGRDCRRQRDPRAEQETGRRDQEHRIKQDMSRRPLAALFEQLEQVSLHAESADSDRQFDGCDGQAVGAERGRTEQPRRHEHEQQARAQPKKKAQSGGRPPAEDQRMRGCLVAHRRIADRRCRKDER
jgi:hypothetical protein